MKGRKRSGPTWAIFDARNRGSANGEFHTDPVSVLPVDGLRSRLKSSSFVPLEGLCPPAWSAELTFSFLVSSLVSPTKSLRLSRGDVGF